MKIRSAVHRDFQKHFRCSTFNTYEGTYFNGREKFAYDDNHDFAEPGFGQASAIITGCDSWTLYRYVSN